MNKKLIIFDYDGVLVDSLITVVETVNEVGKINNINCHLTVEDFDTIEDMTYGQIIQKAGISESDFKIVIPQLFEIFVKKTIQIKLFNGISTLIKELAKEHRVVVVSGNIKSVIEEKFKKEDLFSSLSFIWGADSPGDKAEKILKSMEMFNAASKNTFMIGDSKSDIIFAKEARVKSIAVTWGWQHIKILKKTNPDYVIDTPDQLLEIIQNC